MEKSKKAERILIFELNWLGDILFSFPFIRAIRGKFPEAFISVAVVPRYADLLVNNPWINDIYILSDDRGSRAIKEKISFTRKIRKQRFDTCFLLKPSRTKALIAALAGIKTRIGFEGKDSLITCPVDPLKGEAHRADQILSLSGAVGIKGSDDKYEYFLNDLESVKASKILRQAGAGRHRKVVINPGGNWDAKRWPLENYKILAERIVSDISDVEVIVTGSKKDIGLAQDIVSFVDDRRCYSIAGKTGLNELASVFKDSSLMISADSGPLHLASANNTRTIGLFGPTSCRITGPRGKQQSLIIWNNCGCEIPCYVEKCEKAYACMTGITVDQVFDAAKKILNADDRI